MESLSFQSNDQINLYDIQPFSAQISVIPQYVFENCNQVTCHTYKEGYLPILRKMVKNITREQLTSTCKLQAQDVGIKGEELDWVNGLDSLEGEFKDKQPDQILEELLKVETVMKYNGIFSRFANDKPGDYRKEDIVWPRHDFSINESVAQVFLGKKLEEVTGHTPHSYLLQPVSKIKPCVVKRVWFNTHVNTKGTKNLVHTHRVWKWHASGLDLEKAFSEWSKEQNREDDTIDLVKWYKDRYHFFPFASTIPQDLEQSLASVREAHQMHPIEKACKVWFDIVRIHISHKANKRTGKALASIILLSHGYLPPKIEAKDEKTYLAVLNQGFEEENGHLRLTQFVARLIKDIQDNSPK